MYGQQMLCHHISLSVLGLDESIKKQNKKKEPCKSLIIRSLQEDMRSLCPNEIFMWHQAAISFFPPSCTAKTYDFTERNIKTTDHWHIVLRLGSEIMLHKLCQLNSCCNNYMWFLNLKIPEMIKSFSVSLTSTWRPINRIHEVERKWKRLKCSFSSLTKSRSVFIVLQRTSGKNRRWSNIYLLILANLFTDLRVDHSFSDWPGREKERLNCETADYPKSTQTKLLIVVTACVCVSVCVFVSPLPGLGGKILTEVFHNIEGINSGSSKNASSCLETQICKREGGWMFRQATRVRMGKRWVEKKKKKKRKHRKRRKKKQWS